MVKVQNSKEMHDMSPYIIRGYIDTYIRENDECIMYLPSAVFADAAAHEQRDEDSDEDRSCECVCV